MTPAFGGETCWTSGDQDMEGPCYILLMGAGVCRISEYSSSGSQDQKVLDQEFWSRPGYVFILGTRTWRVPGTYPSVRPGQKHSICSFSLHLRVGWTWTLWCLLTKNSLTRYHKLRFEGKNTKQYEFKFLANLKWPSVDYSINFIDQNSETLISQ